MPTEVGDIEGTKLFEIDTGAFKNVVGVNVAREIAKVQLNSRMTIKGLSGSVRNVYGIDKTALYFDHVQQYRIKSLLISSILVTPQVLRSQAFWVSTLSTVTISSLTIETALWRSITC